MPAVSLQVKKKKFRAIISASCLFLKILSFSCSDANLLVPSHVNILDALWSRKSVCVVPFSHVRQVWFGTIVEHRSTFPINCKFLLGTELLLHFVSVYVTEVG